MKILIGCVKTKKEGRLKAVDKYNSPLFKKELEYAKKICNNVNDIYILSAKYGLIELDKIIDDYNLTLNNFSEKEKKKWAVSVIIQSRKYNFKKDEEIIFLCGNNYSKYLKMYFTNYKDPTQNLSLGNTLKWYNEKLKR